MTGRALRLRQLAAAQLAIEVQRLADDADRVGHAQQILDDDLLVLEHLVVLEEPANLQEHVRRQLALVDVVRKGWIAHADGDDFVVDPLLVAHAHDADGARLDDRQGLHGFLGQHQRVERIPVVAERARDETVVGRIVDRAVEHAIETEEARLLVQLVLVGAAFRHLDDDRKRRLDERVVYVAVVPGMHLSK